MNLLTIIYVYLTISTSHKIRKTITMAKLNCFVAQSGGPTVAINSSLAGVIKGVADSEMYDTIYGSVNGILGILDNRILNLSEKFLMIKNFCVLSTHLPCILVHAVTNYRITTGMTAIIREFLNNSIVII